MTDNPLVPILRKRPAARRRLAAWLDAHETPEGSYRVICIGPMAPEFLVTAGEYELVATSNARLYPTVELERITPFLEGLPCFNRHVDDRPVRTRLLVGNQTKVGHLAKPRWDSKNREIQAVLEVTSDHWREELRPRYRRWSYGFSFDLDAIVSTVAGLELSVPIVKVYSLDVVDFAAAAGRFSDAPAYSEERLKLERQLLADAIESNRSKANGNISE